MVLLEKFMYLALPMKTAAAKVRTLMKSNLYLSSSLPLLSMLGNISNSQVLVTTVKIFFSLFFFLLLFFLILFLLSSVGWAYICAGARRLQKRALDPADLEQHNMGSENQILVHALMCQVISPAPMLVILTKYILIFFFTESFWEDLEDFYTENIRLGKVPTQRWWIT